MSMKHLSIILSCLLLAATAVQAQETVQVASAFEERILNLEKSQAELYHTLTGQKEAGLASRIAEHITLSGLLEVEASADRTRRDDDSRETESGMSLATAFLAFGAKVDDNFSADLSLLYEEGEGLDVDEAAINYNRGPWNARIGQQYLPFGVYHSHFISDPLTLALGETRAAALLTGFEHELFSLSGFVFDGTAGKEGRANRLNDWGASLIVTPLENLTLGGSYLSDLADTDAALLDDVANEWNRRISGASAFAILTFGDFDLAGEYLCATRAFADGAYAGLRPRAWNVEAGYNVRDYIEVALRYEGSREFLDQPKRQYGTAVSWSPAEQLSLSLEYLRGKFDNDGKRDLVTAQIALEF